jgi:hypothetical protein
MVMMMAGVVGSADRTSPDELMRRHTVRMDVGKVVVATNVGQSIRERSMRKLIVPMGIGRHGVVVFAMTDMSWLPPF